MSNFCLVSRLASGSGSSFWQHPGEGTRSELRAGTQIASKPQMDFPTLSTWCHLPTRHTTATASSSIPYISHRKLLQVLHRSVFSRISTAEKLQVTMLIPILHASGLILHACEFHVFGVRILEKPGTKTKLYTYTWTRLHRCPGDNKCPATTC